MTVRLLLFALLPNLIAWSSPDSAELFDAIRRGDQAKLDAGLRAGIDPNARNAQGTTLLMQAALHATPGVMRSLLSKGADPNATNGPGSTALIWAAGDPEKVRLLLDHRAKPNTQSKMGRTALMAAAAYAGNVQTVRLLLSKGADPRLVDAGGEGVACSAAGSGDPAMVRTVLDAGASVAEKCSRGARGLSPLMLAAGVNCTACVDLFIAHKADVNGMSNDAREVKAGLQELGRLTPLLEAAQWNNKTAIAKLLDHGADVNTPDARGLTPLMMAIASDRQDPDVIRLLLERGANRDAVAKDGQTGIVWARKWGNDTPITQLLATGPQPPSDEPVRARPAGARTARAAVERSLDLILNTTDRYFEKSGCVGCHHQMLGGMLVGAAQKRGLTFNRELAAKHLRTAVTITQPVRETHLQRFSAPGSPMVNTLLLLALAAQGYPADPLTDALLHDVAGLQRLDGSWTTARMRQPMQISSFPEVAFAIRAMRVYGSPGRAAEWDRRVAAGRQWLLRNRPTDTQERAMQVLGLHWSGAPVNEVKKAVSALLALQRSDGGWSQRPEFSTDAYATGQALYSLSEAAPAMVREEAYRRGANYLLANQYEDGSWYVKSRAPKFQPYFESGFPHGHDQWISAAATAWAAMALIPTIDIANPAQAAGPRR